MRIGLIYICTLVILLGLDATFLLKIAGPLFRQTLGDTMLEQMRVTPAILFYLMYPVALMLFVSLPAVPGAWPRTLLYGALFGFFAYGTYDFTNYATLKPWTLRLVLTDLIWGSFVSAVSATGGLYAGAALARLFSR